MTGSTIRSSRARLARARWNSSAGARRSSTKATATVTRIRGDFLQALPLAANVAAADRRSRSLGFGVRPGDRRRLPARRIPQPVGTAARPAERRLPGAGALVYTTGWARCRYSAAAIYVGGSLEVGNAWISRSDVSAHNLRKAGSVFVGRDTYLGPFYIAYGRTIRGEVELVRLPGPACERATPTGSRAAARAVWHPCTQMKVHETLPLVPIARARRRVAQRLRRPPLPRRGAARGGSTCSATRIRAINAALADQLDALEHVMLAGFTHAPVVELSERLAALAPPRARPRVLRLRRRVGDRDRAQDERSTTGATAASPAKHGLRGARRQLSRRDARRAGRHRRRDLSATPTRRCWCRSATVPRPTRARRAEASAREPRARAADALEAPSRARITRRSPR